MSKMKNFQIRMQDDEARRATRRPDALWNPLGLPVAKQVRSRQTK
jgi:hypothetical protein